ncbi:peptidoglycan editing factor PgeF [uncultured Desulfuromonas sp.]|uniref:peptidoglycan editing factor PgeF n=1 Tax=uncultured Desulfuromonas sp. TaxID=181013 RepID=UPI002AAB0CB9|nr:peptidoglycan editing factor PgeF [uncultured Desulfuromonas sp.]
MNLEKHGKISCLQADWCDGKTLFAGVTTRNGGVSRPPYNSLNLGSNTEDAAYNVEGNRSTLLHAFDLPLHHLLLVKQVHGNDIIVVDKKNYDVSHFQDVEADAIITNQPGLMLGVTVADCYPLIVFDPKQRVAAVVHVGWRGAANGLIGKVFDAMREEFSSLAEDLLVAVGPGISAEHYDVGKDVREGFRNGTGHWDEIATEVELGKWRVDLQKSCLLQLEQAGIKKKNIDCADACTWNQRELFFSYRRDGGKTGRQMGFVLFRDE